MNSSKRIASSIILIPLLLIFLQVSVFPQYQIPLSVFSGGGEKQSNSTYQLWGIANQSAVGKSSNSTYTAQLGFWFEWQTVTDVEKDEDMLPLTYKLEQNYPNPFNPSTVIKFSVPERSSVVMKIYDILGSEVATLVDQEMDAGWYRVDFNASGYSTGVYIYRMKAGNYISTKKMLLIK